MDQTNYLLLHIPGRGRLTLSLPRGVERAVRNGRLPGDTEALHETDGVWLPLNRHPAVEGLLGPDLDQELGPLVLISLEEPRAPLKTVRRMSSGLRPSVPAKVVVAGAKGGRPRWLARLSSIERWVMSLAVLLVITGAFSGPR